MDVYKTQVEVLLYTSLTMAKNTYSIVTVYEILPQMLQMQKTYAHLQGV
mgnify:CR=1 FL=1